MSRNTLIGFILIGLILLFYPKYLELVSPQKPLETPQEKALPKSLPLTPFNVEPKAPDSGASKKTEGLSQKKKNRESFFHIDTSLFSAVI